LNLRIRTIFLCLLLLTWSMTTPLPGEGLSTIKLRAWPLALHFLELGIEPFHNFFQLLNTFLSPFKLHLKFEQSGAEPLRFFPGTANLLLKVLHFPRTCVEAFSKLLRTRLSLVSTNLGLTLRLASVGLGRLQLSMLGLFRHHSHGDSIRSQVECCADISKTPRNVNC